MRFHKSCQLAQVGLLRRIQIESMRENIRHLLFIDLEESFWIGSTSARLRTAGTFFVTALLAGLLTVFTSGIGFPWEFCMIERWKMEHAYLKGGACRSTAMASTCSATGLSGIC